MTDYCAIPDCTMPTDNGRCEVHPSTESNVLTREVEEDPSLTEHLTCCTDHDMSLCGAVLRGIDLGWHAVGARPNQCVVCIDLNEGSTCPRSGRACP